MTEATAADRLAILADQLSARATASAPLDCEEIAELASTIRRFSAHWQMLLLVAGAPGDIDAEMLALAHRHPLVRLVAVAEAAEPGASSRVCSNEASPGDFLATARHLVERAGELLRERACACPACSSQAEAARAALAALAGVTALRSGTVH